MGPTGRGFIASNAANCCIRNVRTEAHSCWSRGWGREMKETNLAEENLKLPYISSNGKIPVILALDIGGTHIRVCRVEGGEIVQTFRHSSVRSDSHAEPADAMMEI